MHLLGSQPDESSPCLLPCLHGIRSVSEPNSSPGQRLGQVCRFHKTRQACVSDGVPLRQHRCQDQVLGQYCQDQAPGQYCLEPGESLLVWCLDQPVIITLEMG